MASSSTSRLRRCSIRCRARFDLSTVSTHTLGAAQVHGHGLVTPPVLGAVQWEFMALRTVYEMACFLVSFEGYVLVNMQYKFQLVQMTVVVLCLQFIDELDIPVCFLQCKLCKRPSSFSGVALGPVLDMPVVVQRHMHSPRVSRSSTFPSWRRCNLLWFSLLRKT